MKDSDMDAMINGLMPQLIKDGIVKPVKLKDFGFLIPSGKLQNKEVPKITVKYNGK